LASGGPAQGQAASIAAFAEATAASSHVFFGAALAMGTAQSSATTESAASNAIFLILAS
jgi:hypothetical protein